MIRFYREFQMDSKSNPFIEQFLRFECTNFLLSHRHEVFRYSHSLLQTKIRWLWREFADLFESEEKTSVQATGPTVRCFQHQQFKAAIIELHDQGQRVYLCYIAEVDGTKALQPVQQYRLFLAQHRGAEQALVFEDLEQNQLQHWTVCPSTVDAGNDKDCAGESDLSRAEIEKLVFESSYRYISGHQLMPWQRAWYRATGMGGSVAQRVGF